MRHAARPWPPVGALGERRRGVDAGWPLHGRPKRQLPRPLQPAGEPHLDTILGHRSRETGGRPRQHMRRAATLLLAGSGLGWGASKAYRLLTSGALTLDL